ncbi:MAG TPA: DUF1028 domain-containing protein [Ornithinimicrobium sp.]|uniref:DUF1028 domain-containing protein n=1 Tax=Ornithinimicrobium sp. TaxID=1977084 RepID=UPI002B49C6DE|nr:DUF1028 domain-containing protein [Ornithinimicrobium sp.]HKJ12754.1 DUF1028 domain-containing protein [Ornithinimicrobium sp.]
MTFALVATNGRFCAAAISTRTVAVGGTCLFVTARGAVSTQAWTNPLLGLWATQALEREATAGEALAQALERDPDPQMRQALVVSRDGTAAAHTGQRTTEACGDLVGDRWAVGGNMLVGVDTLHAMAARYVSGTESSLGDRVLAALRSGQDAGGDVRGRQSAALTVFADQPYPWLDLRVDDHPDPVTELERLNALAARELRPFVDAFPTLENPAGKYSEELRRAMAATSQGSGGSA